MISAISNAEATTNETPMPDSVPAGVEKLPDAYHAHVTKLDATTGQVSWRRSLLWGKYYSNSDDPSPGDPGMHIDAFAVAADGVRFLRVASDGSPTLCGTYRDWQVGDTPFDSPGVFVEQLTFDALAK